MSEPVRASQRELNHAQRAALDLSSNIALTAAAGSGKTTVLIERFLEILRNNGYRPEEVVAITFTEEAARQMCERVREEIEGRAVEEVPGGTRSWRRALTHLPRSQITTIHGFCHSLLREYSWAIDLDSDFELLDPSRQQLLAAAAVSQTLQDSSFQGWSSLRKLLHYLPQSRLEGLFRQMLGRRHHLSLEDRLDEEWLRDLYLQESAAVLLRASQWDRFLELLRTVPEKLVRQPNSFSVRCRKQLELLERRPALDPRSFVERFGLTLESRIFPTPEWRHLDAYSEIVAGWKELRELVKNETRLDNCTEEGDRHFREALSCVHELHREIVRCYEAEKQADGGLDFEDLLQESARLVQRPDIVASIRERFRFFLVDEYQDTNALQWRILLPLVQESSNLLVVGDAKQSIYRFRNADVSVFRRVQGWVDQSGRVIEMPGNYRAAPTLLHFCNEIFSRIFSGDLEYEASHQQMEEARLDSPDGKVESFFFTLPPEAPATSTPEPFLVASTVERLVEQGYRYSDMAILLRARTRLKFYEESLRLKGIPFQTIGGTGFYRRQEVLDLLNLLRFLHRPQNDIALVGVLRSPLFSLTDEDLVVLSSKPGRDFWKKLGQSVQTGRQVPGRLKFARERLASWLQRAEVTAVSVLLEEALAETGFLPILRASRRGQQARQNVRKLIALVRNLEKERRVHLREVVRFLEALTRTEPNEPEAQVLRPGEDAVRIFTIHGAKGLQFRAVILPELGHKLADIRRDRFVAESFATDSGRVSYFGFKIRDPSNRYRDLRHPTYQMLRRLDEYRQLAEEKRLLYVALTRAQDHLVLLGEKTDGESYSHWLRAAGSDDLAHVPAELEQSLEDWLEKDGYEDEQAEEPPEWVSSLELKEPSSEVSAAHRGSSGRPLQKRIWSPTELTAFHLCPRRFFLGELLAHPEVNPFAGRMVDPVPSLLGEVVHDVIEKTRDIGNPREVEGQLKSWRKTIESRLTTSRSDFENKVRRHLGKVAGGQIYQELQAARRAYREQDFHIRRGDRRLTGVLDALYQRDDLSRIVVDFKTVGLGDRSALEVALHRGFTLQVELYLWAANRILETSELKAVLFFTTSGETVEVEYSPELRERCDEMIDDLPTVVTEEAFPLTTRPGLCQECGFKNRGLCPGADPNSEFHVPRLASKPERVRELPQRETWNVERGTV